MKIFETQIDRFGGRLIRVDGDPSSLTHILIDDEIEKTAIAKIINTDQLAKKAAVAGNNGADGDKGVKIVRTKWLSGCIKQKRLLDEEPYEAKLPKLSGSASAVDNNTRKRHSSPPPDQHDDRAEEKSIYDQTTDEEDDDEVDDDNIVGKLASHYENELTPPNSKKANFACESPSSAAAYSESGNPNKLIIDKLRILAEGYKSTNDKWRALSYEKAIQALIRYPKAVSSFEEVRNMPGIGQRLAEKIWEIHESGELRKADEFNKDEKVRAMKLFTNIFGVGPTIANQWFVQGLRTLKDAEEKAKLNFQQQIGLRYYEEFQMRMDREEAGKIVEFVAKATRDLNPDLVFEACGSYRRGCKTCGDVDILITHPDGHSQEYALGPLVNTLREAGFLTDDLVECDIDGSHRKYMGVCKLDGEDKKHRRIDIIAVPYEEYATSLVYFTGSVYFVRSIYGKAKHMGMRLNQHGLRGGIMRQGGETLNDGYQIPTPTEESVFEKLGIPYRTPQERDI